MYIGILMYKEQKLDEAFVEPCSTTPPSPNKHQLSNHKSIIFFKQFSLADMHLQFCHTWFQLIERCSNVAISLMNIISSLISDLLTDIPVVMNERYHKATSNRMKYVLWEKKWITKHKNYIIRHLYYIFLLRRAK